MLHVSFLGHPFELLLPSLRYQPISFRFEYLPTAENSMTYVVPKAIMVHHRRVKSALSFSSLSSTTMARHNMRWMVELIQIAFDLSRPVRTRFQNGGISKGS